MIREKLKDKILIYSTKEEGNMSFKFDYSSQVLENRKRFFIKKLKDIGITSISDSNLNTGNSRSSFFSHRLAEDKSIPEGRFAVLIFDKAKHK